MEIVSMSTTRAASNRSSESRTVSQIATLAVLLPKDQRQRSLLRVQPVLRLVEHHRLRPFHHFRRHLLAAVGRQVVHEDRVRLRQRHHRRVYLIPLKRLAPRRAFLLPSHARPHVRVHHFSSRRPLARIAQTRDRTTPPPTEPLP